MPEPPTEWLQQAADNRLPLTGKNVVTALRYRGHIQVIDSKGQVMDHVTKLEECRSFNVTKRGLALLETAKKVSLPFNKSELPKSHEIWLSSLRRCLRNIPKGFKLTEKDGEVYVLVADTEGKVEDDALHQLASFKVPWHKSK
jgi:hypothetical protein